MNDFILTIAILAQLTGLSLPQIIQDEIYILPSYNAENNLSLEAGQVASILPSIAKKAGPQPANNFELGPSDLQATAAIVADVTTGQILFQKNQDAQLPIASITKVMTSLVFMEHNPGWDKKYAILPDENYLIGAKLSIENNQELSLHDLLRVTLVGSANNTAKALSRSTGLSDEEFKQAMNDKAQQLGLEHSQFVEPTGLEQADQSSASDLVEIFREALTYKEIRNAMLLKKHAMEVPPDNHFHEIKNTNKLLLDEDVNVIGGKTGFTYEAGYCLATLSEDQGHEIIVITLGLPSEAARDYENKRLISWAFNNYIWN